MLDDVASALVGRDLGADNDAVLTRVLGLKRADVQRLRKSGVL